MALQATIQLDKFVEKTKLKRDTIARKIVMEMYRGVLEMTPIDTGRAAASWNLSLNRADLSETGEVSRPAHQTKKGKVVMLPKGQAKGMIISNSIQKGNNTLKSFEWGDTFYITNNVFYTRFLEYGHSKQAPGGMMRVTFTRVTDHYINVGKTL